MSKQRPISFGFDAAPVALGPISVRKDKQPRKNKTTGNKFSKL